MNRETATQTHQESGAATLRAGRLLQRKCDCGQHTIAGSGCSDCEKKRTTIQRTTGNSNVTNAGGVPPIVHEVLSSPGQSLDAGARAFMEPRFGRDFSRVRVHTDAKAAESARAVNALAFTVGNQVVLGAGQYAPSTRVGQRLLAHELAHTIQQGSGAALMTSSLRVGASNDEHEREAERVGEAVLDYGAAGLQADQSINVDQLQRSSEAPIIRRQGRDGRAPQQRVVGGVQCPAYQPNEMQVSFSEAGHLNPDVFPIAPGKLLIADFGVDWRHVKQTTANDPTLRSWLNTFETNDNYRLRITGYSDCLAADNVALRQGRAQRVEALLGSRARSRVTFRGMAGLSEYVATNQTVEGRARNRGVVIDFHQEITIDEPTEITVTPRRCGPDSTQWLINQMNTNRNHPVIRTAREVQWPRYVPVFNLGWTYGFLSDFRDLVRANAPWDFKSNQPQWRAHAGAACPTQQCDRTVTLCGHCFNYDVPGNLHYGWIGSEAGLRSWFLHNRADAAQAGGVDDPRDAVAIDIGIAMSEDGASLCDQLRQHRDELNVQGTDGCNECTIR